MSQLAIITKFDAVTIENDTRISAADKEYCEAEQTLYSTAANLYLDIYVALQEQWKVEKEKSEYRKQSTEYFSEYVDENGELGIGKIRDKLTKIHHNFISNICRYFSHTYDIKIDSCEVIKSLGYESPSHHYNDRRKVDENQYRKNILQILTYKPIVDKIILDLNGHSFTEKSVQEIKTNALSAAYWGNGGARFTVKKAKIQFDGLTYSSNSWGEYEISLNKDEYKAILRALTHFDSGKTQIYDGWITNFVDYHKYERSGIYDIHETTAEKVMHFKYFKNGKWEITFSTHQNALNFAKEYLNYKE